VPLSGLCICLGHYASVEHHHIDPKNNSRRWKLDSLFVGARLTSQPVS
jgi:hypothetical protein